MSFATSHQILNAINGFNLTYKIVTNMSQFPETTQGLELSNMEYPKALFLVHS